MRYNRQWNEEQIQDAFERVMDPADWPNMRQGLFKQESPPTTPLKETITMVSSIKPQVNICAPHLATLPDGTKILLPAGTVLEQIEAP